MDDTQQMLVNELRRLDRAISQREKALARAQAQAALRTAPRRYVLEFEFLPAWTVDGVGAVVFNRERLNPETRSFVVDRDCVHFCCQEITYSVQALGQVSGVTQSNTFTLSPAYAFTVFDFVWKIRDTATDREWQNHPMPSLFLGSGLTGPLGLGHLARMPSGTELEMVIEPTLSNSQAQGFGTTGVISNPVQKYTLQVSFVGYEVLNVG